MNLDEEAVKQEVNRFICEELLRNRERRLDDDEPIVTGGILESFTPAQIGVHIEQEFELYVPDTELTTENCDSINPNGHACVEIRLRRG